MKKEIFNKITSFGRDTITLIIGIFIGQLIPLFLQPYLKRVFEPEDFGTYDVFLKTFSVLVALSSLKYENAILLPKKENDAKHVFYLCILFSFMIFIINLCVIFIFYNSILSYFKSFTSIALFFLPFSVLSYSVFNASNIFLIRKKRFFLSSTNKVIRRLFEGGIQSGFGCYKNSLGLIIGDVIGNVAQALFSIWKLKSITPLGIISKSKLKKVLFEYKDLPLFTLFPNILNTFVLGSLTFLILSKFDLKEVGFLEFTQKILSIPSVFISIAISQVVFQRVSQLVNQGKEIIPLLKGISILLTFSALFFVLIIHFFGEQLFVLIGGKGWETSGYYAKILVYGSAVMLVFSPLGKVLIALKKFKLNSAWEIGKFLMILGLFFINNISIENYLIIYTIIIVIFYVIYGILIFYTSYKYQIENKVRTE